MAKRAARASTITSEWKKHVVVLWIEMAGPAPELKSKPWPDCRVVTVGIEVPAGTPRYPDGTRHPPLYLCIECLLNLWSHLDGLQFPPLHCAQAVQDVVELRLDHIDHRIVTQAGVWAYEQEHIRKPRDGRSKVGAEARMPSISK